MGKEGPNAERTGDGECMHAVVQYGLVEALKQESGSVEVESSEVRVLVA